MLSVSLLYQVYRLEALFPNFFCGFLVVLFWACFSEFLGASGGVPGGLLEHFFVKKREFKDFGNTSKSMACAVFQQV